MSGFSSIFWPSNHTSTISPRRTAAAECHSPSRESPTTSTGTFKLVVPEGPSIQARTRLLVCSSRFTAEPLPSQQVPNNTPRPVSVVLNHVWNVKSPTVMSVMAPVTGTANDSSPMAASNSAE